MDYSTMNLFLSDENIKIHMEYLKELKLRYSILQKSCHLLDCDDIKTIFRKKLNHDIKKDALEILCDVKSHELFFNSFINVVPVCNGIKRLYGSKEKFIFDLYVISQRNSCGFVYVFLNKNGIPTIKFTQNPIDIFINYDPVIAYDLFEHTYFKDYGFNRNKYFINSLRYLNLKLLEDKLIY